MRATMTGTRSTETTASKSQEGPKVSGSGRGSPGRPRPERRPQQARRVGLVFAKDCVIGNGDLAPAYSFIRASPSRPVHRDIILAL